MSRRFEHDARGAGFDHLAEIHDQHPFAELAHHREVVAHEDQRGAALALHARQQLQDLRLDGHVERAHRLVADQQSRRQDHGARDGNSLALTAGQRRTAPRGERSVESDVESICAHVSLASTVSMAGRNARRGSAMHSATLMRRIEARERILENDLQGVARLCAAPRPRARASACPASTIVPGRRPASVATGPASASTCPSRIHRRCRALHPRPHRATRIPPR